MIERGHPLFAPGQGHTSFNHISLVNKHVIIEEEEENHDRTVKPVVCPQRRARPQQFIIGDNETELELSLGSRSFLDRVNDQVRKREKRSSMNVTEDDEKHSVIWGMFMSVTLEQAVLMVKNYSDNWQTMKNTKDLTMKQMFDISAKLVSEQDEIYGVKQLIRKIIHGNTCHSLVTKELSIFNAKRSTSFQILYCVLVRYTRDPNQTLHGKKDWSGSKHLRFTETWTESTASQWNSIGIFSKDSIRCSSVKKSKSYC